MMSQIYCYHNLFQLRLEYFIAVAVAVIIILIVVLIVFAVLLIRICKNRLGGGSVTSDKITGASVNGSMTALSAGGVPGATVVGNGKVAPIPAKMPKHIQMGTGFRTTPVINGNGNGHAANKPDLLTDAPLHNLSRNSVNTNTTTSTLAGGGVGGSKMPPDSGTVSTAATSSNASQGSYRMAMENIIEDYSGRYV